MAYQNYYPQFYPPVNPIMAQQVQPQQTQQHQNSGVIWVNSENEAKTYPVAPGQSVFLFDRDNLVFYVKSADQSGMALPLRIFDYKERVQNGKEESKQTTEVKQDYVSREEFDRFRTEIRDEIRRRRRPEEPVKEAKNV